MRRRCHTRARRPTRQGFRESSEPTYLAGRPFFAFIIRLHFWIPTGRVPHFIWEYNRSGCLRRPACATQLNHDNSNRNCAFPPYLPGYAPQLRTIHQYSPVSNLKAISCSRPPPIQRTDEAFSGHARWPKYHSVISARSRERMDDARIGPKYRESKLRELKEEMTQTVPTATRWVPNDQCASGRLSLSNGRGALFGKSLPLTATPLVEMSTVSPSTATIGFINGSAPSGQFPSAPLGLYKTTTAPSAKLVEFCPADTLRFAVCNPTLPAANLKTQANTGDYDYCGQDCSKRGQQATTDHHDCLLCLKSPGCPLRVRRAQSGRRLSYGSSAREPHRPCA